MTEEFLRAMPTDGALEARFSFIDNQLLKENIIIYFRYIVFLLNLSGENSIGDLKYQLYKDIIVYTDTK